MLISSRVCCNVTCRWLSGHPRFERSVTTFVRKYEEDACLRNVDRILPIDTASHHRRLASPPPRGGRWRCHPTRAVRPLILRGVFGFHANMKLFEQLSNYQLLKEDFCCTSMQSVDQCIKNIGSNSYVWVTIVCNNHQRSTLNRCSSS